MTKPMINSQWVRFADNQTYKVVGIKTIYTGQTGVEVIRFIKNRNAWAKTPVCFSYLDQAGSDWGHAPSQLFFEVFAEAATTKDCK